MVGVGVEGGCEGTRRKSLEGRCRITRDSADLDSKRTLEKTRDYESIS